MTDPCMLYMATWIPSIYPLYVSIYTSTMDPSWGMDSHGGFGGFEVCLQLGHHPQGEMIGLLPESHKNQDASANQKPPLGHVRCSSEIPGKILRKIGGNLSMEVLADGKNP